VASGFPTNQKARLQEVRIMSGKASDLFNRLPSANELLEKPPIRALANHWNRSVVAAGVRSFLDELRNDLQRRTSEVNWPSLRELAERAAHYVTALQQPAVRGAINATGRFFGPEWSDAPLADEALEQIVALGRGYVSGSDAAARDDAADALCQMTGAEAATVVSSYAGATWLALAAGAAERHVVVARRDVGEIESGSSLATVADLARVTLREVGAVNRLSAADYETAVDHQTAAILRHTPDYFRVTGETDSVELEALVGLARDRELPLVDLLGAAPLVDRLPGVPAALRSIARSIAVGSHLVVARGNGLVGGPRCGLILGRRDLVRRVEAHPLFGAWNADTATRAALRVTIEQFSEPERAAMAIPLYQLLAASVGNLRQRAERLAPQLEQADDVERAVVVESDSRLGLAHVAEDTFPSFAIELTPSNDVESLENRLRGGPAPVIGRRHDGRLCLDLRTVLPRQDRRLVEVVAGRGGSADKTALEVATESHD
jgi:L-seryl-tRNA(Ser) seleniumtransferase